MVRFVALMISLSICAVACGGAGSWRYEPASEPLARRSVSGARVAVLPFDDERGSRNRNLTLLYLIPVIGVVGPISYERIESGSRYLSHATYQIRPAEDLAKAVVAELKAAKVFEEVFYTERERESNVDLFLKGTVSEMSYSGGIISYGLSAYGPILWLFGLPAGYATNRLKIGLELRTPGGEVVWKGTPFESDWSTSIALYYNFSGEFDGYPTLMHGAVGEWIDELVKIAPQRTEPAHP